MYIVIIYYRKRRETHWEIKARGKYSVISEIFELENWKATRKEKESNLCKRIHCMFVFNAEKKEREMTWEQAQTWDS